MQERYDDTLVKYETRLKIIAEAKQNVEDDIKEEFVETLPFIKRSKSDVSIVKANISRDLKKLTRYSLDDQYGGKSPLDTKSRSKYNILFAEAGKMSTTDKVRNAISRNMKNKDDIKKIRTMRKNIKWENPHEQSKIPISEALETTSKAISSFPYTENSVITHRSNVSPISSESPGKHDQLLENSAFFNAFFQGNDNNDNAKNDTNIDGTANCPKDELNNNLEGEQLNMETMTYDKNGEKDSNDTTDANTKPLANQLMPGDVEKTNQTDEQLNDGHQKKSNTKNAIDNRVKNTPNKVSLRNIMSQERSQSQLSSSRSSRHSIRARPPSPNLEGWDEPDDDLSALKAATLRAHSEFDEEDPTSSEPAGQRRSRRRPKSKGGSPRRSRTPKTPTRSRTPRTPTRAKTPRTPNGSRKRGKGSRRDQSNDVFPSKPILNNNHNIESKESLNSTSQDEIDRSLDRHEINRNNTYGRTELKQHATGDTNGMQFDPPPSDSTSNRNISYDEDDIYKTLPRINLASRGEQLEYVLQLAVKLCRAMPYVVDELVSVKNKGFVNKVKSMWQTLKLEISKLDDDYKTIAFQKMQVETQEVISRLGRKDRRLDKDFLRPWKIGNGSLYTEIEQEERNLLFMNDARINELFEMIWHRVEVGINDAGNLRENAYGAFFTRIGRILLDADVSFEKLSAQIRAEFHQEITNNNNFRSPKIVDTNVVINNNSMSIFLFRKSVFELCDCWCEDSSRESFSRFLALLLDIVPQGSMRVQIQLYEAATAGNRKALYQIDHQTKKARKKLRSPENSQFSSTAPALLQSNNTKSGSPKNAIKKKLSRKERKKKLAFSLLGGIAESHNEDQEAMVVASPLSISSVRSNPFSPHGTGGGKSPYGGMSPQNGLTSLSESNSEWQAQMSDSSESSSDSDDESDDDEEALGVKSKVGPRFANVSGSEAWYLKRNNIKKN